jgi:hypothetical protein
MSLFHILYTLPFFWNDSKVQTAGGFARTVHGSNNAAWFKEVTFELAFYHTLFGDPKSPEPLFLAPNAHFQPIFDLE